MKRIQFIEIEDQNWCPKEIRNGVTNFLEYIVRKYHLYHSISPMLFKALQKSNHPCIIDLCSGAGSAWLSILNKPNNTSKDASNIIHKVILTDLYPNHEAFNHARHNFPEIIDTCFTSVDATEVNPDLKGFRTLFSSFHHFEPSKAKAILQNAVDCKEGIAIFESTQRHPLMLLYMLFTPLIVLAAAPFIRPFKISHIILTYLLPIIPLVVMFDGIISCLRTYTVDELNGFVNVLRNNSYHWESGVMRFRFLPIGITYLIGTPQSIT
ncbi:hypothetical protein [Methylomonas rhizoryzae]|uniref:hypothetical protein n=1 Tax=Methylomonas rhizoryzae TaxID=2608981 RepID=UPI0012329563|nr:hypothetical protein [Methylomonas rhizoryzae]